MDTRHPLQAPDSQSPLTRSLPEGHFLSLSWTPTGRVRTSGEGRARGQEVPSEPYLPCLLASEPALVGNHLGAHLWSCCSVLFCSLKTPGCSQTDFRPLCHLVLKLWCPCTAPHGAQAHPPASVQDSGPRLDCTGCWPGMEGVSCRCHEEWGRALPTQTLALPCRPVQSLGSSPSAGPWLPALHVSSVVLAGSRRHPSPSVGSGEPRFPSAPKAVG